MNIFIREAHPDDAERIIPYVHQLSEESDIDIPLGPGEFTYTVEQERVLLSDYAASDNSIFLIAEAEGAIIGMLNILGGKRRALRHAGVLGISVGRDWRNRSIGSLLMGEALRWAKESGVITRVELHVYARNTRAIHLYEKFGFEVEGRRRKSVWQDGEYLDDLLMGWVV